MYVNVKQVVDTTKCEDDEDVEGLYEVVFSADVIQVPLGELAGWALDIFHAHQGIECLDDFEITVLNKDHEPVTEDEAYECGVHNDHGDVYKVSDEPVNITN